MTRITTRHAEKTLINALICAWRKYHRKASQEEINLAIERILRLLKTTS